MLTHAPTHRPALRRAEGFTLIELMVVLAILIILGIVALPNLQAMIPHYKLNSAAKDLVQAAQQARLAAIAHGRQYRIRFDQADASSDDDDPSTSQGRYFLEAKDDDGNWDTLPLDDSDTDGAEGTYDLTQGTGVNSFKGISIVGWTAMGGPDLDNADCIVFSPSGWVANPTADFEGGFIYVQLRNKYANPVADVRTVRLARGGGATILEGAFGVVGGGSGSSAEE